MIEITATIRVPQSLLALPQKVERARQNGLNGLAMSVLEDFRVTVQTWMHQPQFVIDSPNADTRVVGVDMVDHNAEIYGYVSGGTSVRYATMMPGYVAKSVPGYIQSGPGGGGVLFISKLHPRPGIQARRFASAIAAKWRRLAGETMQRAVDAEIRQ